MKQVNALVQLLGRTTKIPSRRPLRVKSSLSSNGKKKNYVGFLNQLHQLRTETTSFRNFTNLNLTYRTVVNSRYRHTPSILFSKASTICSATSLTAFWLLLLLLLGVTQQFVFYKLIAIRYNVILLGFDFGKYCTVCGKK